MVVYFKLTVMLLFRFYGVIASIPTPWALMNLSQYLWSTLFLATLSSAQGILLSIHSCWHNVLVFASPSLLKVNSDLRHILWNFMSYQLLADWVIEWSNMDDIPLDIFIIQCVTSFQIRRVLVRYISYLLYRKLWQTLLPLLRIAKKVIN